MPIKKSKTSIVTQTLIILLPCDMHYRQSLFICGVIATGLPYHITQTSKTFLTLQAHFGKRLILNGWVKEKHWYNLQVYKSTLLEMKPYQS